MFKSGIPVPSDSCWKDIANKLDNVISEKYLYTIVKSNRYNIRNQLVIESKITPDNVILSDDSNDDEEGEETVYLNITLSVEEWKLIGPKEK